MVDYSKWDNYKDSDSDDENLQSSAPMVTTLEPNSRIEIGPDGSTILKEATSVSHVKKKPLASSSSSHKDKSQSHESGSSTQALVQGDGFLWYQTGLEVNLRISVPEPFLGLMSQAPRRCGLMALQCKARRLVIKVGTEVFMDKQLAYDIVETDSDGDCAIDWEIRTLPSEGAVAGKEVCACLKKKSPIAGAVQWWSRVFTDDINEVDVTKIPERVRAGKAAALGAASSSALPNSLQSVWAAAHEQFCKNVADATKIDVEAVSGGSAASVPQGQLQEERPVTITVVGNDEAQRLSCRRPTDNM